MEDVPAGWETAGREGGAEEELEWLGDVEWEQPPRSARDFSGERVEILLEDPRPPSLPKFKEEIEKLSSRLNLSEEVKMQVSLYLPFLRPRLGDRKTTCAAIVLHVCRNAGVPKTLKEISSNAGLDPSKILKRLRLIRKLME